MSNLAAWTCTLLMLMYSWPLPASAITCNPGLTFCTTLNACVNLKTNPAACGSCTTKCPSATPTCSNGKCCPAGKTFCAALGRCVDLSIDSAACGACSNKCAAATPLCFEGKCRAACPIGWTFCAAVAAQGAACFDLRRDANACGRCPTNLFNPGKERCADGAVCTSGKCACPASRPNLCPNAGCVNLQNSTDNCGGCQISCGGGGAVCSRGVCRCPAGRTLCSTGCENLQTNPDNCGTCGNFCPLEATCKTRRCVCPALKPTVCDSACVNLNTSTENCGICGKACARGALCTKGKCACPASQPDLCKIAPEGAPGILVDVCVNLQTSVTSCGKCGTKCPLGAACVKGRCAACPAARPFLCANGGIPGELFGKVCDNLQTSVYNCGKCAVRCPDGASCKAGKCVCPAGRRNVCPAPRTCGNCPVNPSGVCTNVTSDNNNCGKCSSSCLNSNVAKTVCTAGKCACPATLPNVCPFIPFTNKICVNVKSTAEHCGQCGNVCPRGTSCIAGKC